MICVSGLVENIVGKGENAGHQHFLFFPQCFLKASLSRSFNSLPNGKILNVTKLKAFADNKLNIAKMKIFLFDRVENAVAKGENAGYQHFLLFPQCFPKPSSLGSIKIRIVW